MLPHRRSIRLQGYDYAQAGAYFVTICTQHRECLFGDIVGGAMVLNAAGQMVQTVWDEIPAHYPGIDVDAFVIMPNHIHGIVVITTDDVGRPTVAARQRTRTAPVAAHWPGKGHSGRHGGLPLQGSCHCRMWCIGSKP